MNRRQYAKMGVALMVSGWMFGTAACSDDANGGATSAPGADAAVTADDASTGDKDGGSVASDDAGASTDPGTDPGDDADAGDAQSSDDGGASSDDAASDASAPGNGLALGTVEWIVDGVTYTDTKTPSNFRWNGKVLIAEFTAGLNLQPQNRLSVSLYDNKAQNSIPARSVACDGAFSFTIMTKGKPISHDDDKNCTFTLDETITTESKEMRGSFVDSDHAISGRFRVALYGLPKQ